MKKNSGCIRVFADQKQITRCKNKVSEVKPSVNYLAKALNLAGNEVRLNILYLMYEEGELCVCDLSDIMNMKTPAISQHLRKLKDGGIIEYRKDGQTIYYSLSPQYHTLFEAFFLIISKNKYLHKTG